MATTTFAGPVTSTGGFIGNVTGDVTGGVTGAVAATTVSASGAVSLAAGAVGTPSLTFTGDTNLGVYRSAADTMVLVANGAAQATITTGGINGVLGGTTPAAVSATTVSATTSATVGSGTAITKIAVYSQTVTPASVAAATVAEQTFTVTGLTTADKVFVNHAATGNATGIAGARVSAANTLAVSFVNPTAGALVPGAGTWSIVAIRS